jgi:hypothetical protein
VAFANADTPDFLPVRFLAPPSPGEEAVTYMPRQARAGGRDCQPLGARETRATRPPPWGAPLRRASRRARASHARRVLAAPAQPWTPSHAALGSRALPAARQALVPIKDKAEMDDFFKDMGEKSALCDLEPAAAIEYRQRLSHACGAANGLYASGMASDWPSAELSLQPALLASVVSGGVGAAAPAADARAAAAPHPTAKRTGARTKRLSAAAAARAGASDGGATQPAAEAAAPHEAHLLPPPEAPAPPRRRSGAKRRPGAPLARPAV